MGWAFHKPYWIGQRARANAPGGLESMPAFAWEEPADTPIRQTILYDIHRKAGAKIAPFAGWEMPIRYTSVQDEHLAVRQAAGLFDVSHMGLFEFSGDNVHLFLNTITTNDVSLLEVGQAQYSFLLDQNGHVLDDVYIYRLEEDRYWMVVNAANNDKDWAWVNAVCRRAGDDRSGAAVVPCSGHRNGRHPRHARSGARWSRCACSWRCRVLARATSCCPCWMSGDALQRTAARR